MGRVGEVISTERDADGVLTVRVDPGGGAVKSAEHFADSGSDCVPLPGDYAAIEGSAGEGSEAVTGYHDPRNPGVAEPGEARQFARNAGAELVGELWLKRDGTCEWRSVAGMPMRIITTGPVIIDSPDVRLSDSAGAQVARVGDIVVGALAATAPSGGGPLLPGTGPGVPFAGQITSGSAKVKA